MTSCVNVKFTMGNIISLIRGKEGSLSGHEAWRVKHRFRKVIDEGAQGITPERFKNLLGSSGKPCAELLFKYVDADSSGSISYEEICDEIKAHRAMKTPEAKLLVLFNFYDQDHDGKISPSEIGDAMQVACQGLPPSQLDQMVHSTMEEFDVDKDGFLNFVEFSALILNSGLELNP